MNTMKIGDVVMSCYSSRTVDAIGIVTGDYEWHDDFDDYKRVRRVKWLVKGVNEDIVSMNDGKTMTLGTVYRLNAMTLDKVKTLLDKYEVSKTLTENTKPYVIVIDEMNRGNVAKIFGELITLLETDKRKGRKNAESVILPYSKKPFYIPSNVYLIATMNTADRSLGTIDYAIRRRFAFVTIKPIELEEDHFNAELFRKVSELFIANYDEYANDGFNDRIKLIPAETLCEEYRPEDVWIGQSYFLMEDDSEVAICSSDKKLDNSTPEKRFLVLATEPAVFSSPLKVLTCPSRLVSLSCSAVVSPNFCQTLPSQINSAPAPLITISPVFTGPVHPLIVGV